MSISEMRNTTTGKVVGFLAALTLVMSLAFGAYAPVQAQTVEELQEQISELLALVAALQAATEGTTSTGDFSHVFLADLGMGSTGTDVMMLQKYLNMNAATRVATTGAGAPGMETSYYGSLTANAVTRYQELHRGAILTPLGLASGTGYFGASTRAHLNAAVAAGTPGTPGTPSTGALKGGEAVIQNFSFDGEDDASEGQESEVAVIEYDIIGGDVELNRLDLVFNTAGTDESRPWRAIDEIVLLDHEGDEIDSFDVSNRALWSSEGGSAYSTRLSGLDYVTRMGDTGAVTVVVALNTGVLGTPGDDFVIVVPDNGLRFVDAAGLVQYAPAAQSPAVTWSVTVDVLAENADDSLSLRSNSNNPKTGTLRVYDDKVSGEHVVAVATLRVGNNDVDLLDGVVRVTTGTATYAAVVDKAFLSVDGEEADKPTVVYYTDNTFVTTSVPATRWAELTFNMDELDLDGDEDYDVEVSMVFEENTAGDTVQATIYGFVGEGVDDVETGSTTFGDDAKAGNVQSLVDVEVSVTSVTSMGETLGTTTKPGYLRFNFTVEAEDGDVTFVLADVERTISGADTSIVSAGALSRIGGTAVEAPAGTFTIQEGDSATFSLEYVVSPTLLAHNGTYYVTLESVLGVVVNKTASVTVAN
jgi:hypothetical protein